MKLIDLTGQRFGRLVVIDRADRVGKTYWRCVCDCGGTSESEGYELRQGHSRSCGCLRGEDGKAKWTKHGGVRTPEYYSWNHMRRRCSEKNSKDYKNYGGRGITVCERWDDFAAFLADMGLRPTPQHTIERVDNDKGYSPDNCIWATRDVQGQNRRNVLRIPAYGENLTIRQIVNRSGLGYACVYKRFRKGLSGASLLEGAL